MDLAAHLLNDAWNELFEAVAVISNDTDLPTPIRMVAAERRKPVIIVYPIVAQTKARSSSRSSRRQASQKPVIPRKRESRELLD